MNQDLSFFVLLCGFICGSVLSFIQIHSWWKKNLENQSIIFFHENMIRIFLLFLELSYFRLLLSKIFLGIIIWISESVVIRARKEARFCCFDSLRFDHLSPCLASPRDKIPISASPRLASWSVCLASPRLEKN